MNAKIRLLELQAHVGMHTDVKLVYDDMESFLDGHKILLRQLGSFLEKAIDHISVDNRINCKYLSRCGEIYPSAEFVTNLIYISFDHQLITYFVANVQDEYKIDFVNFVNYTTNYTFVRDALKKLDWTSSDVWKTNLADLADKIEKDFPLDNVDFVNTIKWMDDNYIQTPLRRVKVEDFVKQFVSRRHARFDIPDIVNAIEKHEIELDDTFAYNIMYHICETKFLPEYKQVLQKIFTNDFVITILKEMFDNKIKDYESAAVAKNSFPILIQFRPKDRSEMYISEKYASIPNIVEGLFICIDEEEDWPDITVTILDKFVHKPNLYLKLLKFKHKRLLEKPDMFNKVLKLIDKQTQDGVKYHLILKIFYNDVSEMPEYVFTKWFNIIKNKKWLIQEIPDKYSSLNFKRKRALSEEERLSLKVAHR